MSLTFWLCAAECSMPCPATHCSLCILRGAMAQGVCSGTSTTLKGKDAIHTRKKSKSYSRITAIMEATYTTYTNAQGSEVSEKKYIKKTYYIDRYN